MLQLPVLPYCVGLNMVPITRHLFINIFLMEHFQAVKFAMGRHGSRGGRPAPQIKKEKGKEKKKGEREREI